MHGEREVNSVGKAGEDGSIIQCSFVLNSANSEGKILHTVIVNTIA